MINLLKKTLFLQIVLLFCLNIFAVNVGSVLELYNVRNGLDGSYTQTADIDLNVTDPDDVSDWSSQNYDSGSFVKYGSYTYICILTTTLSQNPSDTDYWKQLWESSKGWDPLGDDTTEFTGTYNGAGYEISNLYISRPDEDYVGLFGRMTGSSSQTARLENIKILSVNISGRSGVGSLLGKIDDNQYVLIDRCSAVGGSINAFRTCGGLVGANNGYPSGTPAKSRSKLFECFANVDVAFRYESGESRTAEKFGGLVGCNQRGETYDSYAMGDVSGSDGDNDAIRIGGLAGCVEQGLLVNCFSTGAVSGSGSNVGGLTGNVTGQGTGGVSGSYWDTQTSGQASSPGGTGLTTSEMKTGTAFTNWDTGFWTFSSGSYPGLIWNSEYTLEDIDTVTGTLIYQGNKKYENTDLGALGKYLAFQSEGDETAETYLIYAEYSEDNTLTELAGFTNPENMSAYCRIWYQDQNGDAVSITTLNADSYFYLQFPDQPQDLWFRYNTGSWQTVPACTLMTGEGYPDYTYKIVLDDLNLSSRYDSNTIEFTGDNGDSPLPVTLSIFTAVFDGEVPYLQWITQTEINNAGWNVYRSQINDLSAAMQVNPVLIDGQGTTSQETRYEFYDLCSYHYNTAYYYWLESLDYSSTAQTYGPIAIFIPVIEDENNNSPYAPLQYGLHANHPNPFNPSTKIRFLLEYNSSVFLEVYNLKGEKVKTLLNGVSVQKKQENFAVWDGNDASGNPCSSGLYYYRLTTKRDCFIRKMLLVK